MSDDSATEMFVTDSLTDLVENLQGKNETDLPLRIANGVLTNATSIPDNLYGKTPWLIISNPVDDDMGYLVELYVDNPDDIAEAIERIIDESSGFIDIDDVFILYGYELNVCLAINEDEIDEDTIEICKSIAAEAEKMTEHGDD